MSFGSINDLIINTAFLEEVNSIKNSISDGSAFPKTLFLLRQEFPNLSEKELIHFLNLLMLSHNQSNQDKVQLVVTAPPSFGLHTKLTENVVEEMLGSAKKSILITGYSISDYINNFLELVIKKSQSGVFVKIYINNIAAQESIDKLVRYKGKFLKIYNYSNKTDKMSALHAKVLSVDGCKSLVSSANLSYHGMSGNIELGCFIESSRIAKEIDDLFKQLLFQKVFNLVKG